MKDVNHQIKAHSAEQYGNSLQYSCLENLTDRSLAGRSQWGYNWSVLARNCISPCLWAVQINLNVWLFSEIARSRSKKATREKRQNIYKVKLVTDFSAVMVKARRQGNNTFKMVRENNLKVYVLLSCQLGERTQWHFRRDKPRLLYPKICTEGRCFVGRTVVLEGRVEVQNEWACRQTEECMDWEGDADCVKPKYHLLWEADKKMNSRLHVEHKYYIKLI